jgi:hypothetical protein
MLKTVRILASDGTTKECTIEFVSNNSRLVLSGAEFSPIAVEGADLFESLIKLRLALEPDGFKVLCAGARKDVHPSGMSRQMSGGRKAYIHRFGSHSSPADLVDIFDDVDVEHVGTVLQQEEFQRKWIDSLKQVPWARKK